MSAAVSAPVFSDDVFDVSSFAFPASTADESIDVSGVDSPGTPFAMPGYFPPTPTDNFGVAPQPEPEVVQPQPAFEFKAQQPALDFGHVETQPDVQQLQQQAEAQQVLLAEQQAREWAIYQQQMEDYNRQVAYMQQQQMMQQQQQVQQQVQQQAPSPQVKSPVTTSSNITLDAGYYTYVTTNNLFYKPPFADEFEGKVKSN